MLKLVVFLAVVFAFVALAWMLLLPLIITSQLRARTGFDATIQQIAVNPLVGTVELKGLVITNPPTFPAREFLDLREFRANAELFSLLTDRPIFDSMTLDIAKVALVKRSDGATNASAFQKNLENSSGDGKPHPPRSKPPKQFLIRRLQLRIDHLVIADYTGRDPRIRNFPLAINQKYVDVTDPGQLMAPKILQNLTPIAAAVSSLLPDDIGKLIGEAADSSAAMFKETSRETAAKAKQLFDALEESKKP